ncbi:hypothetical protein IE044AEMC_01486 [Enterococcus faecalis]|uniref:hypothetical protein n=1 Tax=Enterococcus faecalis TaxID=1351 RepID=UPI00115F007C|nr:hypothetical protein [Enterococcus faecalis]CAC9764366.1 hypothetical protein IE313HC_01255 [Enterococcus faecalis]CAC9764658.1 hypothetical protein IE044AEGC_01320 [Enterococcus faecalis]CAC9770011.1 hypothetical protein IE183ART_02482 [Enterococcus faecalis]CAC9778470.1 hypothetical protein IE044AEMC_01486 [Enterococcus faecalis]CAC9780211.1 hypothetical protein IE044CO2MC_01294 [Enterococcus faecalis]
MKFKSQGQMLSYVKEKEKGIIKEIDRRAEREVIEDNKQLSEYKYVVTSILDAEAIYDVDRPIEEKKFSSPKDVDKYLATTFKDQMDSAWKEMFGK